MNTTNEYSLKKKYLDLEFDKMLQSNESSTSVSRAPSNSKYLNTKSTNIASQTSQTQNVYEIFSVISIFHQFFGLPYYGRRKTNRKFLNTIFSLIFISIYLISHFPGILIYFSLDTIKNKSLRLTESRSAQIIAIILLAIDFMKNIDNDLILLFKGKKFCQFYEKFYNIPVYHKLYMGLKSRRKLLRIAWLIIIVNMGTALLYLVFYYPVIHNSINSPEQSNCILKLPQKLLLNLFLIIKLIGTIHSKAFDSIIIYVSLIINCYFRAFSLKVKRLIKEIETTPSYIAIKFKNGENFEDTRITLIALQQLVKEINFMISPSLLLTVSSNLISVFGGMFVVIDLFGYMDPIEDLEALQIYNAFICLLSLCITCIVANSVRNEAKNSLEILKSIRIDNLNELDYKSVSIASFYLNLKSNSNVSFIFKLVEINA